MTELKSRAQFFLDWWTGEWGRPIDTLGFSKLPNYIFDKIMRDYTRYLINNGYCPSCYQNIATSDAMHEEQHCHNCGWIDSNSDKDAILL